MINLNKLRGKRVEKGFTQVAFSKKIGISVQTYNLKEQGKREFTANELIAISRVLEENIDFFCK